MNEDVLYESKCLYNKVKKIYQDIGYDQSYKLNTFWADQNMRDMLKIINESNTAEEAIHAIQKTWLFSVNTPEPEKEKAVDWHLKQLNQSGYHILTQYPSIQESEYSNPALIVLRDDKKFTPDFLRTVNIAFEIIKICEIPQNRKFRIVELGAGCGHLARTIRFFIPNNSHIIIDIPETLFFSYIFLKLNFPEAKFLYLTHQKQLEDISIEDYHYIFIPTMFAESIIGKNFDLFINTASLGEMDNSIIRYWMDFVQNKIQVKYLFTLNRYLNTITTNGSLDWRLDENECSVLYDSDWEILNWQLEPPFTRCPYVDTIIARYVEIIAKRGNPLNAKERNGKSQQLLLDVMSEDWVRLEKSFPSVMTYRDNILASDLTKSGTLFKLWESIRLDMNVRNISLMLKYLDTLMHNQEKEFEETFYYEKMFEKLSKDIPNSDLLEIQEVINLKRKYRASFSRIKPSFESYNKIKYLPNYFIPKLVEESYYGFNIVRFKNKFHAISQDIGHLDLTRIDDNKIAEYQKNCKFFISDSFYEVKNLIIQLINQNLDKDKNELQVNISAKDSLIHNLSEEVSGKDLTILKQNEELEILNNIMAEKDMILTKKENYISSLQEELAEIKPTKWYWLLNLRKNKKERKHFQDFDFFIKNGQTYKILNAFLFKRDQQPWRNKNNDHYETNPIISMICQDEVDFLHWLVKSYFSGEGVIVDMGPLAGGSTHAIASGLALNPNINQNKKIIYSYDLWDYFEDWAQFFPGDHLVKGQDVYPFFKKNLGPYMRYVKPIKGDIQSKKWSGEPIEILFIDAAKSPAIMQHIVNEFFPFLIPGKSIVIQQDFCSAQCPWIHITMQKLRKYFTYIDSPEGGSICYLFKEKIPSEIINSELFYSTPVNEGQHLFQTIQSDILGWYNICIKLAEVQYIAITGDRNRAKSMFEQVLNDPLNNEYIQYPGVQGDIDLLARELNSQDE